VIEIRHLIQHYVNVLNHVVHLNVLYHQHVQLYRVVISPGVHVVVVEFKEKRVISVQIQINDRMRCARKKIKFLYRKFQCFFSFRRCETVFG
jgi:hypothetical protein